MTEKAEPSAQARRDLDEYERKQREIDAVLARLEAITALLRAQKDKP